MKKTQRHQKSERQGCNSEKSFRKYCGIYPKSVESESIAGSWCRSLWRKATLVVMIVSQD